LEAVAMTSILALSLYMLTKSRLSLKQSSLKSKNLLHLILVVKQSKIHKCPFIWTQSQRSKNQSILL